LDPILLGLGLAVFRRFLPQRLLRARRGLRSRRRTPTAVAGARVRAPRVLVARLARARFWLLALVFRTLGALGGLRIRFRVGARQRALRLLRRVGGSGHRLRSPGARMARGRLWRGWPGLLRERLIVAGERRGRLLVGVAAQQEPAASEADPERDGRDGDDAPETSVRRRRQLARHGRFWPGRAGPFGADG